MNAYNLMINVSNLYQQSSRALYSIYNEKSFLNEMRLKIILDIQVAIPLFHVGFICLTCSLKLIRTFSWCEYMVVNFLLLIFQILQFCFLGLSFHPVVLALHLPNPIT